MLAVAWFIFVMFIFILVLWLVLLGLSSLAMKQGTKVNRESVSAFECGFDSKQSGRVSFSINFASFLVLFLVFDIELVFFFHFPLMSTPLLKGVSLFVVIFVFVGFLLEENSMSWT